RTSARGGLLPQLSGAAFLALGEAPADPRVAGCLRDPFARKRLALPVAFKADRLIVAMANPSDVFALDDIRSLTNSDVEAFMAEPGQLQRALDRVWNGGAQTDEILRIAVEDRQDTAQNDELAELQEAAEDAPIIQFVNHLLARAINERASDVHIEPTEKDLRVRFRVDGVLQEVMAAPRAISSSVVSRLKIMADIDI